MYWAQVVLPQFCPTTSGVLVGDAAIAPVVNTPKANTVLATIVEMRISSSPTG
jgi:hypothetical protein